MGKSRTSRYNPDLPLKGRGKKYTHADHLKQLSHRQITGKRPALHRLVREHQRALANESDTTAIWRTSADAYGAGVRASRQNPPTISKSQLDLLNANRIAARAQLDDANKAQEGAEIRLRSIIEGAYMKDILLTRPLNDEDARLRQDSPWPYQSVDMRAYGPYIPFPLHPPLT